MAKKASRTAELAALARASMHREPALRGPDDVAVRFLSAPLKVLVSVEPLRRAALRLYTKLMPGSYAFVGARTWVFDSFIQQELRGGARQVVVLGAGYDTRAYRFAEELRAAGACVFEVDAPATSRLKQDRVRRLFGSLPPEVAYVQVDFERDSLEERLTAAGYSTTARTAFLWEGVTYYLQQSAVEQVLRFVRERSGPGSAIIFDLLHRGIVEGSDVSFGAQQQRRYVQRKGEPFIFGLDPEELPAFLARHGMGLEEVVKADEMEARYFTRAPKDSTPYRLASFNAIAVARAKG
ncbi:SAM-dependent methyltransferase [Pyxidicoccus parkwayensis]|uniref:S-adenosyl-L-methionine-dependent methyltransferase n=1 Tax=Pyxidicoccus parkwayensis TaxID=2813578 RepID=A0ABX7NWA9_9BACT|nr:SAM-dependent methyltransferase [Pyxidicoccus parkwaysis]QSQ23205.1 SAM-dependent methyltransferase [Pyxidicoccus parkwaysis]